jgi:DNA polymerase I-like protein with 3'-5' exonuclease and polymerase domains
MARWNVDVPVSEYFGPLPANPRGVVSGDIGALIRELEDTHKIAADSETTGLGYYQDHILYWSLAWGKRRCTLHSSMLPYFTHIFNDPRKTWIGANFKFDMHMYAQMGQFFRGKCWDTKVQHCLLFEEESHALKDMARSLLGWRWTDFQDTFGKIRPGNGPLELIRKAEQDDFPLLVEYAANDAWGTLGVSDNLEERLKAAQTHSLFRECPPYIETLWDLFAKVEAPYTKVLWKNERYGIGIDQQKIAEIEPKARREIEDMERELTRIVGWVMNPDSAAHLRHYFFDQMKMTPRKMTSGGQSGKRMPSTDADFIDWAEGEGDPVARILKTVRKLKKLHGTYILSLPRYLDANSRIHTQFNQDTVRCMPAGELVLTDRGYLPVESVVVGDRVLTHTGQARRVSETSIHPAAPIFKVHLANGFSLRTTGHHEYLTRDHGWKRADALARGDVVVIYAGPEKWEVAVGEPTSFSTSIVNSVLNEAPEVTYGLTVELDHSHVTGGIVTHNTGRLSSSEPNLQVIPTPERDKWGLRSLFVSRPGYDLIVADYNQLEMRLLAAAALEQDMINIFLKGWDIHMGNAEIMYGIPYDELKQAKKTDKEVQEGKLPASALTQRVIECLTRRGEAKNIGFGLNYGMGAKKLANDLGISVAEAEMKIQHYKNTYKAVSRFYEEAVNLTRKTGYAFTVLGRRRNLPDISSSSNEYRSRAERQAVNVEIQGCLPAHTRILTSDGYIPIGRARTSGTAWTGSVWAEYELLNRGECELAELELSNGQVLACDVRHQVLVQRLDDYCFAHFDDLVVGDQICMSLAQPLEFGKRHAAKEHYYWMGFATGNAWSSSGPAHRNAITFTFGDRKGRYAKEEKARAFYEYASRSLGVLPQKPEVHEGKIAITLESASVRRYYESLGYAWGETAHEKRVPKTLWTSTLSNRCAFLTGLLDADGHLHVQTPNIHLCQRELLEEAQVLFRTVGIESTVRGPYVDSWRLDLVGSQCAKHLAYGSTRSMQLPMPIPRQVAVDILQREAGSSRSHTVLRSRLRRGGRIGVYTALEMYAAAGLQPPDLYATRRLVEKRRLGRSETTYTLSIKHPSHRFDSEGVISKNSAADVVKVAQINLDSCGLDQRLGCIQLINVHDELIFECPKENVQEAKAEIKDWMEHPFAFDLAVPLTVAIGSGRSWREAK